MANTAIRTPALTDERRWEEAWRAHELRVAGWPLRRIARELHMSVDTVSKRLEWANRQIALPMVVEHRKVQNERLENLLAIALEGVRRPLMYEGTHCTNLDGTPLYTVDLDAVEKARKLINDLSDLHGTKAPVEIEHKLITITEEDMVLVDAFNAMAEAQISGRGEPPLVRKANGTAP